MKELLRIVSVRPLILFLLRKHSVDFSGAFYLNCTLTGPWGFCINISLCGPEMELCLHPYKRVCFFACLRACVRASETQQASLRSEVSGLCLTSTSFVLRPKHQLPWLRFSYFWSVIPDNCPDSTPISYVTKCSILIIFNSSFSNHSCHVI